MKKIFSILLIILALSFVTFGQGAIWKGWVGSNFGIPGNLDVDGITEVDSLHDSGNADIDGDLNVDGDVTIGGDLSADTLAAKALKLDNQSSAVTNIGSDSTVFFTQDDTYNVHFGYTTNDNGAKVTRYGATKQDILNGDVGQSLWFDGVDDNIDCGDSDDFTLPDSSLTIYARFLVHDLSVSVNVVCSKILNASTCEYLMYVGDDGALRTILYDSADTANTSNFKTSTGIIQENKIYDVVFVYDGNNSKYYINGVAFTATEIVGGTGFSVFTNTAAALQLGARIINSNYATITLYGVRFFNLSLDPTDEEDLAIINGGAVPYKYQGASQTAVYISDWSVNEDSWIIGARVADDGNIDAVSDGSTSYNDCYRATTTVSSGTHYVKKTGVFEIGKSYRITFSYYIPSSNTYCDGIRFTMGNVNTDLSITGAWTEYTLEVASISETETRWFMSDGGGTTFDDTSGTDVFYLYNMTIIQIGCVADYSPEGIGHNQWTEVSGNKLHGTISGAKPVNLPANHSELYNLTVTGETTFTLPSGYMIDYIIAKETTGNTITALDFGFTDGGGEIVAAADFTGSDEKSLTVLQRIDDFDAADVVYISATAWNSASLDIVVRMKRMVIN